MLLAFVIALREGLEGALIVSIVAAFLKQRARLDLLRLLWSGVAAAALVCLAGGIALHVYAADLPQRQQEGLETVIGLIAVGMVTYMVIWMRRNAKGLRKQLEGAASLAMESGSGLALVAMAFLAVFREGFETAVFMVAAFNTTADTAAAGTGAILGLVVAIILGYGIYRGGVRLNLSKFFRATGAVLVLVAGGLVVSALHTAHGAGWLNIGQARTFDLSWLVAPNTVQESLLNGMLGLQAKPVLIEVVGWLVYVIPIGLYVVWPPGRAAPNRAVVRLGAGVCVAAALASVVAVVAMPDRPTTGATALELVTAAKPARSVQAATSAALRSRSDSSISVSIAGVDGVDGVDASALVVTLSHTGSSERNGRSTDVFTTQDLKVANPAGLPASVTTAQVLALNGGRLPLGARFDPARSLIRMTYTTLLSVRADLDSASDRLLALSVVQETSANADLASGPTALGQVATATSASTNAAVARAVAEIRRAQSSTDRRAVWGALAVAMALLALVSGLVALGMALRVRRDDRPPPPSAAPPVHQLEDVVSG